MICLSKLNGKKFMLNADLIETVEETPDTVLTTTTGRKLVVSESASEVLKRFVRYKRSIQVPKFIKGCDANG